VQERIANSVKEYKGAARGDVIADRFGSFKFREFDERGMQKSIEELDSRS